MNRVLSMLFVMFAALIGAATDIDPITMRWTLGAHEPFSMYRRMGKKSTGGIEGSAQWLKPWLDWWDENAPTRMEEFGLNALHARFYKGMGWEIEKKDFPNVKRFVSNCHKHGVMALAYVQFATLYYEPMKGEVPDVETWAAVNAQGEPYTWNGYYCRWIPCITCEEWAAYIERICEIALAEGGFDGVMFDNCFAYACYCPRCEREFNEHMQSLPNREDRFGYDCLKGVRQPSKGALWSACESAANAALAAVGKPLPPPKDVKDPVEQEWLRWRVQNMNAVLARFRKKIKAVKPDAIVAANPHPFCGAMSNARAHSLEMISLSDQLDLLMMQSANYPEVLENGVIRNRVRDLKLAEAVGKPDVALCDGNSGQHDIDESAYLRPLVEDLVWGGIPTDRTVMNPARTPTYLDEGRFAARKRLMASFNEYARANRSILAAPSYQPVRLFYSGATAMLSVSAREGVTAAEEICLRNHVPFGYALARGAAAPEIPSDCEVLVVSDQRWLSDAQVEAISSWAKKGGKLLVTGESGLWDEFGCQRFENPLEKAVAGLPNVMWRKKADHVENTMGWTYDVKRPADGGAPFLADLRNVGFAPDVTFEGLPETVFAEVRKLEGGYAVHLVNYNPKVAVSGAKMRFRGSGVFREPFGADNAEKPLRSGEVVPKFSQYAVIRVKTEEPLLVLHLDFNTIQMKRDSVLSCLRAASRAGYNAVLWEVEDKIRWETCPECVHPEAFSKDEFRLILAEAKRLGLAPIPLLQTFGHAEYVLMNGGHEAWMEDSKFPACYCVSNPEVRAFLQRFLSEYLELFGEDVGYFHLGGDEAKAFCKCPVCSKRNRMKLYVEHLKFMAAPLSHRGIRPCIWCDMVLGDSEGFRKAGLPSSFVVWHWDYEYDGKGHRRAWTDKIGVLKELGHDIVFAAASASGGDGPFFPRYGVHLDNAAAAAELVRQDGLLGLCMTSWSVRKFHKSLQVPIWEFAAKRLLKPSADVATDEIDVFRRHFGPVDPQVMRMLTDWYPYFGAMDASGWMPYIKHAKPAPKGTFDRVVSEELERNEKHRVDMLVQAAEYERRIREAGERLSEIDGPLTKTLRDGVSLALTFIRDIQTAYEGGRTLEFPFDETAAYYRNEQTEMSATNCASIVWSVLAGR